MDALTAAFVRFRQNGDLEALGRVFDAVSPQLLALALHLTGNAADAEDALQATFLVAMRKSTAFDAQKSVAPWLSGILAGEAKNARRHERRRATESLPDDLSATDGDALEAAEHQELVKQLRTRIDVLPTEQRQVLLLQLQHGLQPAEIADVLGVPPGTVRMRIHRGLAALRKALPAGMALGALALFPQRGLAAVRVCVMKAGAVEAAAATTAVAVTIGGLAMKKALLAAVALVTVCFVWWAVSPPGGDVVLLDPLVGGSVESVVVADRDQVEPGDNQRENAKTDANPGDDVASAAGALRVTVRADEVQQVSPTEQESSSSAGSGIVLPGVFVAVMPGQFDDAPYISGRVATATDAGGVAAFVELQAGHYVVAVMAAGQRLGGLHKIEVLGGETKELEIHVGYAGILNGVVVDEVGSVIGGAEIWVGTRLSFAGRSERGVRRVTVSAADGTFSLAHLQKDEYVAARKDGYGASWSHPIHQLGDGDIRLVLGARSGKITGEVVDQHGKPVADVSVGVEPMDERLRRGLDGTLLGPRLAVSLRTDAAGRFAVAGLAPGQYACQAVRLPLAAAMAKPTVASGGQEHVRLVMKRRAAVYGFLRDRAGQAQPGCYVMLTRDDRRSQTTRSGNDGSYRFEGVDYEPYTLSAVRMASGTRVEQRLPAPTEVETRADLVLDEKPALAGTAQTESGRKLGGWHVTVLIGDDPQHPHKTKTRSDGTFQLWGLPDGQHRVRLHRDEAKVLTPDVIAVGDASQPVRLVVADSLLPVAKMRGRVVDEQGEAVAGSWAWLRDADVMEDPALPGDGAFAFTDLSPGRYQVSYGAPGYMEGRKTINLRRNDDRDLGDLVVRRGATVRVTYLRPDGRPWVGRPPMPWLSNGARFLLAGEIGYAIDGKEVVVTRVPPGSYKVQAPWGDELVIPPVTIDLRAGEVRRLELQVQVGRRRLLTFAGNKEDRDLQVVVRRGDGLVVLERKIHRAAEQLQLSAVLPIGQFHVSARNDTGSRFAGDVRIDAVIDEGANVPRIAIPRRE